MMLAESKVNDRGEVFLVLPSLSVKEPPTEFASIKELPNASSRSLAMLSLKCRSSSLKTREASVATVVGFGAPTALGCVAPFERVGRSGEADSRVRGSDCRSSIAIEAILFEAF